VTVFSLVLCVVPIPLAAALWRATARSRWPSGFFGTWIGGSAGLTFGAVVTGDWITMIGGPLNLIIAVIAWWLSRRKRKRAPRSYGAKSRALLARITAGAREAGKPRVLRPVPQAAGS
jgi:membrane protein implicated in regulation of membrane protease activity